MASWMRVNRVTQPTPMSLEVILTKSIVIAFEIMTNSNKRMINRCQVCLRKSTKYVVNLINVFVETISTIIFVDCMFFLMYIFYS